ncbi:MAG: CDGSH iron-sulfur domain-containing protein [Balneolaceae bacterium]
MKKNNVAMESKVYSYKNDEVEVTWDKNRCIHAKECVHGSPEVFDISKKPWINPSEAKSFEDLRRVIEACPTGALHYNFTDMGISESPDNVNTLSIETDGPLYARGDIHIVDMEDAVLMKDYRVAFCRCGASSNKPFCDNSHIKAGFKAGEEYNPERLELEPSTETGGMLKAKLVPNGPVVVEGNYTLKGNEQSTDSQKKMSFCRCGASSNKPFCDGSHRDIDFKA